MNIFADTGAVVLILTKCHGMFMGQETVMNNEETTDCCMGQVTSKQEEDIPSSKWTCYMIASAPNLNVKKVTTVVNNDCQLLIHDRRSDEYGNRTCDQMVDCIWNVMAHARKPDFAFRQNGRVHLNRWRGQFSQLLAGEPCTSACRVCTACASLCSAVMWHLLASHSIHQFPLHFSSCASPCAVTFQMQSTRN